MGVAIEIVLALAAAVLVGFGAAVRLLGDAEDSTLDFYQEDHEEAA